MQVGLQPCAILLQLLSFWGVGWASGHWIPLLKRKEQCQYYCRLEGWDLKREREDLGFKKGGIDWGLLFCREEEERRRRVGECDETWSFSHAHGRTVPVIISSQDEGHNKKCLYVNIMINLIIGLICLGWLNHPNKSDCI